VGGWGGGAVPHPPPPKTPNPQSPIPNPQSPYDFINKINIKNKIVYIFIIFINKY